MYKARKTILITAILILSVLFSMAAQAEEEIVYYNPDGGHYFHSRPNCETIRSEYHPLMEAIDLSRLEEEAFSFLQRCNHCFDNGDLTVTEDGCTRFHYKSVYDTAPEGFQITDAGLYTAGKDFPAGIYTAVGADIAADVVIYAPSGRELYRYSLQNTASCSFYLSHGMSVDLPPDCLLKNVSYQARFQNPGEKTGLHHARFFVMLECPGQVYAVTAQEGKTGQVVVSTIAAEQGLEAPAVYTLPEGETLLLELQNGYDTFVEFTDCVLWPVEEGEG